MFITYDKEATGLLDETTIDYTSSPYKLKDNFKTHCIVVEEHDTGNIIAFYDGVKYELDGRSYEEHFDEYDFYLANYEPIKYEHRQLSEWKQYVLDTPITKVIGHNIINFDLLSDKLEFDMDYTVGPDSWCGKDLSIEDTLIMSKTLNPDRWGGHSLDSFGERVGLSKIQFRKDYSEEVRFKYFAADMLYYCIRDVEVNTKAYYYLKQEWGNWPFEDAYRLEKDVAEIITRQAHRGFKFDVDKAIWCVKDLDEKIATIKAEVEPILPAKPLGKTKQKDYTPPLKQFKLDGTLNAHIRSFVMKHEGTLTEDRAIIYGKEYILPIPHIPLITEEPATLKDTTHIKEWLVKEYNWAPTMYKERDLTVDQKKKKITKEKYETVVRKYVEQTLISPFCDDRLEFIELTKANLLEKLLKKDISRPVKVYTNPTFTIGQEKEICPNLVLLESKFPYARKIVEYLTFTHRRNSILGGGIDWDEDDDEQEIEKGFLANVRSDGRISTPADTCGAGTSRFTHRRVANIPRNSSPYGEEMRSLFGVDKTLFYQLGYDFDSLEARVEAAYAFKYPGGKEYGESLTAAKPNSCHCILARSVSKILGKEFSRQSAKPVKYGAAYGAQPKRIAKIIGGTLEEGQIVFDAYWNQAAPLKMLQTNMISYWETKGEKKFIIGIDKRKIPIRSKGNLINSVFQNCGVICAKRAMVLHDRKLKAEGLIVDFFKEDWRNKQFCQQLIAYHDEAQSELNRELVKFKMFATEEEAKAFKEEGKIWSDVGHTKDKWWRAWCRAGELAAESVREAGEYYKLAVPLSAGYTIGLSWKECH